MISREGFVELINAVIAYHEREVAFQSAVAPFIADGVGFLKSGADLVDRIIDTLEIEMRDSERGSDYGSMISWWLYDSPAAGKCAECSYIKLADGSRIELGTPGQLYDYLTMVEEA